MNYKIPNNILLLSIFICSISSIFTAQQIVIINNKNSKKTLLVYVDYIKFSGRNIETAARTWPEYPNSKKENLDNLSNLVEPEEFVNGKDLIDRLLNDTEMTIDDSADADFAAFTQSIKEFTSRNNPSSFLLYFLYSLLFFLIIVDLYLIYLLLNNDSNKLAKNTKDEKKIKEYVIRFLPEEYINNLETERQRLKNKKLSHKEIETIITLKLLDTLRGYLICKIQNLWLDRNKIE